MAEEEEEELPEPSDDLTRPEKWMAERLTPYRVFYLKRVTNLILILAFLWAGWHLQGVFQEVNHLQTLLDQNGCAVLQGEVPGYVTGAGPEFNNSTGSQVLENFSRNYSSIR